MAKKHMTLAWMDGARRGRGLPNGGRNTAAQYIRAAEQAQHIPASRRLEQQPRERGQR